MACSDMSCDVMLMEWRHRDQELRFTVHESPDYNRLKISIFSEDKRTDLIGEAWVNLSDVISPGGGKNDLWQQLNYKGKYAGELRIELTYYDARPKQELAESVPGMDEFRQSGGSGRVKRRPLPGNPNSGHVTPDTIAGPSGPMRARHGPRELGAPARANSMPPETMMMAHQQEFVGGLPPDQRHMSSSVGPLQHTPPNQQYGDFNPYQEPSYDDEMFAEPEQPDFLPQLPPSNRQRNQYPPPNRIDTLRHQQPQYASAHPHIPLPHSHSAPIVPQANYALSEYDGGHQLHTDYPDPIPDVEYQHQQLQMRRRSGVPSGWQGFDDPYMNQPSSPEDLAPPPPPMHSNSAPVVPQYSPGFGAQMSSSPYTPEHFQQHVRHHSVPNSSPLQHLDRGYGSSQRPLAPGHPVRSGSMDGYMSSPEQSPYNSSPSNYTQSQSPSPYSRTQPTRQMPHHRNSIADPYQTTPSRPHPLSQEVPRPRSPLPPLPQATDGFSNPSSSPYQHDYRTRDAVPLIKPRAISPQPPLPSSQSNSAQRPKSAYSLQYPVRAFESSDGNPLSTSQPPPLSLQTAQRHTPARKSISSHTGTPNSASATIPYSPDSFNIHNPTSERSTLPNGNSPHSPYQIPSGSAGMREDSNGPIVNWHGQEIDPSDHLPVDSWAPEPEKKIPSKTYGMGRDRDFGPRTSQNSATSSMSSARNLSKDTVVNVRMKPQASPLVEPESPTRNRLQKKAAKSPTFGNGGDFAEPLRERHNFNSISVPDPYAQQQDFSSGFYGGGSGDNNASYPGGGNNYNGGGGSVYGANVYGQAGGQQGYSDPDSLAREISSIDIGSGRGRGYVPSPTAYVPVRSHRERKTFY